MPVRLTLIAHGATAATRAAAFPLDEPLEARAQKKAAALRRPARAGEIALTSPAQSARQTAEALGLQAEVAAALRDCDYGRWAGLTLAAVQLAEPDGVATWLADPSAAPHGGESLAALCDRVASWMDGPLPETAIAAVTHAPVIRAAILHALHAPLEAFWRIDVDPLAMADLRRNGARWTCRLGGGRLPVPA